MVVEALKKQMGRIFLKPRGGKKRIGAKKN